MQLKDDTSNPSKLEAMNSPAKRAELNHHVLLPEEDEREYRRMRSQLVASLKPKGQYEFALIDKLMLNLWRNQRLARAEQAKLLLSQHPQKIARDVDRSFDGYSIDRETGQPKTVEAEQLAWCHDVIQEIEQRATWPDLPTLRELCPLTWKQLKSDTEARPDGLPDLVDWYEDQHDGLYHQLAGRLGIQAPSSEHELLAEYLADLYRYCEKELESGERESETRQLLVLTAQSSLVNPLSDILDLQDQLDRQSRNIMQELRAAQKHRFMWTEKPKNRPDRPEKTS